MLKERGVQYLRYVLLFVSLLALLGSVGTTEASIYSSLIMKSQAPVSSPEVILQNGTAGSSLIYSNSTSARVSVEAPLFDFVDSNEFDVDSTADKGVHSNFSAQQAGPDSTYDALEEENTEALEDYVDSNSSDVDASSDIGTHSNFENQKAQDSSYDTLTEQNTGAGITKVGTDTSGTGTNLTLSFSHTLVSGTTRIVIVSIGVENGDTIAVSTVTYGGAAMTLAVEGITGTSGFRFLCEIWYILENDLPSDGSQTVEINCSGTPYELEVNGFCSEYTGVTQGVPEATAEYNQTTGTTITNDINPSENAWVISTVGSGNVGSFTHGQGQVEVLDFQDTSSTFAVAELRGASGETSLDSTYSGTLNRLERVTASWTETIEEHNYELDLEVQFTAVIDFLPTETLCINTGTFSGTEDINVDFWNGTGWENIATDLTVYSCSEYTVPLTSTNFTIRFKGGTESSDTTQDQWQIDASLLRVEGAGSKEDAVDQQSNVDGSADIGTHNNFTAGQYGPDSIYDTLTEADTSASNNNNVDSEIATQGSTTGINGAQTVDSISENMTEGIIMADTPVLASYEVNEGTYVTSISVNKPSGTSSGDLLIILLGVDGAPSPSPSTPTGFTYITTSYAANGHSQFSWYREADGTEGASFSSDWSGGNNEDAVMACLRITGWDSGDFPHKIATNDATSGDPVFPAVTTEKDNCLLLRWYGMDNDDDEEPIGGVPSGHNEIFARATASAFGETTLSACNRTWVTAGDTGTATWNQDATLEGWNTVTLAIAPAVVGYQLDVEHVVNSITQHENYNLTTRIYRSAENFYLQLYNFSSSQWVNMSTITASSLTWYNTTFTKADFVNSTNQARIRYWQGVGAAQETLYVDYCGVYGWNATNYELDLEGHWTDLSYSLPNEELCIYAGAMGTEDITVDVWNGSSWVNVISDMNASSWNNVTIASYLTSINFTIRFKGGSETSDASQDTWQIDVALIHVWHEGEENYQLDLEVQWTSAGYTRINEELCIRTGTFSGSENIQVKVWNNTGSSWHWVMNLTASEWNNVSITSYLASSTFIVQFLGGTETGDTTQDSWNIDATLLHVWNNESTWLNGWDKRVRITINHNDIDSDLSDFPILIYLSNSSGRKNDDTTFIFNEVGSDSKKIAVTQSDGTTQCYAEIEKWDNASEQAWLWVKIPSISSSTHTVLYLYYDNNHADNTNYVGAIGSSAAQNVWDSSFKAVWHLSDTSGGVGAIKDSTTNNNNGTDNGSPTFNATGPINSAISFDGINDFINISNSASLQFTNSLTIEAWVSLSSFGSGSDVDILMRKGEGNPNDYQLAIHDQKLELMIEENDDGGLHGNTTLSATTWYYLVGTWNGSTRNVYLNGSEDGTGPKTGSITPDTRAIYIGGRSGTDLSTGTIDEVRASNKTRSAAWIKACYESASDDLLDFGASGTSEGTYDYVFRVNNTATDSWSIRMKSYSDSNLSRLDDCTISFYNSTDGASNQIIVEAGSYIQDVGSWFDLGDSETIYIAVAVEASFSGASIIYVYLEILTPSTTTYAQYILVFQFT